MITQADLDVARTVVGGNWKYYEFHVDGLVQRIAGVLAEQRVKMNAAIDTPDVPFSKMAERITHNAGSTFGGAFVIVPPGPDAVPVEILFLDASPNPAMFWGSIQAKAQMALADLEDRQRRLPQGFR